MRRFFTVLMVCACSFLAACKDEGAREFIQEPQNYSPLRIMLVDLDGDGPDIVPLEKSEIYFDVEGSGKAKKTAWVGTDDGFMRIFTVLHMKLPDERKVFAALDIGLDILNPYDVDDNSIIEPNEIYTHNQPPYLKVWHSEELNNLFDLERHDFFIRNIVNKISIDKDCKTVETPDYKQLCQGHFEWEDGKQADFYIVQFAYER